MDSRSREGRLRAAGHGIRRSARRRHRDHRRPLRHASRLVPADPRGPREESRGRGRRRGLEPCGFDSPSCRPREFPADVRPFFGADGDPHFLEAARSHEYFLQALGSVGPALFAGMDRIRSSRRATGARRDRARAGRPAPASTELGRAARVVVHFSSGRSYGASTRTWPSQERRHWFASFVAPRRMYWMTLPALEARGGRRRARRGGQALVEGPDPRERAWPADWIDRRPGTQQAPARLTFFSRSSCRRSSNGPNHSGANLAGLYFPDRKEAP